MWRDEELELLGVGPPRVAFWGWNGPFGVLCNDQGGPLRHCLHQEGRDRCELREAEGRDRCELREAEG